MNEPLTEADTTPAERAAWEVAISRGLNISRRDLRDLRAGFEPQRDDEVSRWLKRWRDSMQPQERDEWRLLDFMLDDYRAHADTGTPLDAEVAER